MGAWFLQVDEQKLRRDLETIEHIIKIRDSNNTKFTVSSCRRRSTLPPSIALIVCVCVCVVRPQSLEVISCALST